MKHTVLNSFDFFNACTFRRTVMSKQSLVPRQARSVLRPAMLVAAISAAFTSSGAFAFDSGSTGADGALNPTVNTEIQLPASGILNYTSINIPAGVTVKFKKNALNTPVYLLVSGNATIAGSLDISGTSGMHSGTAGDGNTADDGIPGVGGPGGFDGGRGGRDDTSLRPEVIRGGAGLGPGGGLGGKEGNDGCSNGIYYPRIGGGAGYLTYGREDTSYNNCSARPAGAAVGKPYGSAILQPLIGGSGGGGGRGGINFGGTGGGGGGGALLLAVSGTLQLSGSIVANGGGSGDYAGANAGDHGGGGSGGAVRLLATTLSGAGNVQAIGSCIDRTGIPGVGANSYAKTVYYSASSYDNIYGLKYYRCDLAGASEGRVRIEADNLTFTGRTYPTYTTDTPGPVFLSNVPSLRFTSIAGSTVPANPTGNADLTFPANITNPVSVQLATTNVPPGNTVQVKVIPAYGPTQEVLSAAITGSNASGSASVQVTLPQGPSVLQAVTTYTVVVAMGEELSRFAQNERVEKVQIATSLGGANEAKLITISGKEYTVPMSVLQMVGFKG
jgi:hypothetical protein